MTLLEILLHELESWPAGKEYAFQSATTPLAYFASSDKDEDLKSIYLCQISPNRGPTNIVTREQWKAAKIKSLPFFKEVAAILGEERAVKELLAVSDISFTAKELDEAFAFVTTPQGFDFWKNISEPNRGANKLKHALNTITAALNPEHFLQLQSNGSGSVRDHADNEIIYFANPDFLVNEYLSPAPKFEHWALLHDRYKWMAKDSGGIWWVYTDKPILDDDYWRSEGGECRSLTIMMVDIPCHWTKSLIKRPSA